MCTTGLKPNSYFSTSIGKEKKKKKKGLFIQKRHQKHSSVNREPIKMHCHISTNLGQVCDEARPRSEFWSSHASRPFAYAAKMAKMWCKRKHIRSVRRQIQHSARSKNKSQKCALQFLDSHSLWLFSTQFIPLGTTVKAIKARQAYYPARPAQSQSSTQTCQ